MKPSNRLILAAIVATGVIWSSSPVINKILLEQFNPITIAFVRFVIAGIIILPFFLKERRKNPPFRMSLIPIILLASGNIGFFIVGLQYTVPNASATLYAISPLLIALYAHVFIHERITRQKIIGIIIGFIGALIVILVPALRHNQEIIGSPLGNLLIFIAVNTWAGYTVGSRYLTEKKKYSPFYLMSLSFFGAIAVFGTISLAQGFPGISRVLEPQYVVAFLYTGTAITILTYFLYQWIIKHTSASTASLMGYLQPPSTFVLAWLFLGDRASIELVVGLLLVLAGVFIATANQRKKHRDPSIEV